MEYKPKKNLYGRVIYHNDSFVIRRDAGGMFSLWKYELMIGTSNAIDTLFSRLKRII
jgi:hypothetical protein